MPKGEALKALWADPEWRAARIDALKSNKEWIARRAAMLGSEGLEKAIARRRRKATAKNYDLVRENAIMFWQFQRMKAAYKEMKAEVERTRDEMQDMRETFGIKGDLIWVYCERFGLTKQQAEVLSLLVTREFLTKDQLDFGSRAAKSARGEGYDKIGQVIICCLRKKLRPHGIEIKTIWGEGVCMTPENKAKVKAITIGPFTQV